MDQDTVESGLVEFPVCQQAQISISEACHIEKSPVPVMFLTSAVDQNHADSFHKFQSN